MPNWNLLTGPCRLRRSPWASRGIWWFNKRNFGVWKLMLDQTHTRRLPGTRMKCSQVRSVWLSKQFQIPKTVSITHQEQLEGRALPHIISRVRPKISQFLSWIIHFIGHPTKFNHPHRESDTNWDLRWSQLFQSSPKVSTLPDPETCHSSHPRTCDVMLWGSWRPPKQGRTWCHAECAEKHWSDSSSSSSSSSKSESRKQTRQNTSWNFMTTCAKEQLRIPLGPLAPDTLPLGWNEQGDAGWGFKLAKTS